MAFLLHNPIEPAERVGLILTANEAVLQRLRWRPAPRLLEPKRRPEQ
jgi:hypothetical protein